METAKNALDQALLQAQAAIPGIGKDAQNEHRRYDYTSAEHMLEVCRTVLHEHGLVAVQDAWEPVGAFSFEVPVSGEAMVGMIAVTFRLSHAASGEERVSRMAWPVVVSRGRPHDKALAASVTVSWTYYLRGLLALPRLEGGDVEIVTGPNPRRQKRVE